MITEQSIEVEAPAELVYNRWARFEDFPRFMEGVRQIERVGERQLRWISDMCGKTLEWPAEIIDEEPAQRIAWRSKGGQFNCGTVTLTPLGPGKTRIDLRVEYDPSDLARALKAELQIKPEQLNEDLECFRELVEDPIE